MSARIPRLGTSFEAERVRGSRQGRAGTKSSIVRGTRAWSYVLEGRGVLEIEGSPYCSSRVRASSSRLARTTIFTAYERVNLLVLFHRRADGRVGSPARFQDAHTRIVFFVVLRRVDYDDNASPG